MACKQSQHLPNLRTVHTLAVGMFVVLATLRAAPFDGTRPQWPQLLTNHGPIKSGGTIREEIQGSIDMLLTDMPMTDAEMQLVYDTRGVHLLHVATAVTAVVPWYNVRGLRSPLNFGAHTLAAIFRGKIVKWNDPAIKALNPLSQLPAEDIVVIGHANEDGSTYALSDFLSKTDPEWRRSVGRVRLLTSPVATARDQSPEDIASLLKQTPNSISYMELWAAKGQGLDIGNVRNRSGRYVAASPASAAAAAQSANIRVGQDFRTSITDPVGDQDYPIASFTWVVVPSVFPDSETRGVVTSFLKWVLTEGQDSLEAMQFGRLPPPVANREIKTLDTSK
jgi:phosphate transport system substrate-binding protein